MSTATFTRTSDTELVITRTFRAPPHRVYEVWTNPTHVAAWWAPASHGCAVASAVAEVAVGGAYRYVTRVASGDEFAFIGTYLELSPPTRIVYTQTFEPMAHLGEAVVTVTFDAQPDGTTFMRSVERYPSKDVLDGALASGMESGARETMDQLDAIAAALG